MANLFLNPKPDKRDAYVIGGLIILMTIFIVGYLQSSSLQNFGLIYAILTLLIFFIITLALVSRFRAGAWVFYGKSQATNQIIINFGIGLFIVALILLISNQINFSIAIPLSITSVSTTSNNVLNYLVVSFYAPFIEEIFWIGLLFTSILLYSKSKSRGFDFYTGLVIVSLIILFFSVEFIGIAGIILSVIIMGVTFAMQYFKAIRRDFGYSKNYNSSLITALITADLFIVILHVYAYGVSSQSLGLFVSAFAFFLIEGIIDIWRQSIIPSIAMHTVNNAVVAVTLLNIAPTFFGIPIYVYSILLMLFFLVILGYDYGFKSKKSRVIQPIRYMNSLARSIRY